MFERPQILVYGRDRILLDTRQWVLEGAGYEVMTAMEPVAAEGAFTRKEIALLIMCHTLSPEEREEASSAAKAIRPTIQQLSLTASMHRGSAVHEYEVCSLFDGPKALVTTVDRLLGGSRSHG